MVILDIIVIIILAWLVYKGFSKGIIIELASLLALVLGVYGAIHFSELLNPILLDIGIGEKYLSLISFALMFILILIVVHLIAKLITKLIDLLSLSFINKIGGAAFGALKALLICTVIMVFTNKLDERLSFLDTETKEKSFFYNPMITFAESVFPKIMNEYLPEHQDQS